MIASYRNKRVVIRPVRTLILTFSHREKEPLSLGERRRLKEAGAQGIVEYPLNKIVM